MIVLLAPFAGPVADPDFWWHVQTGRHILAGGLPAHDLYTYTVPGHRWTDHEWLTEVLMAWLFDHLGFTGVAIAFALITWAGFWVLFRSARAGREPYVVAAAGLVLAAFAGAPIWGPRAQMITFALACLELHWIRGYLAGRSRAILFLPLVMVAWANLHGGWVVAFAFLGVAIVAEAARLAARRDDLAARAHVRRLLLVTLVSAAAVMATPHGPSLLLYPFETQGSSAQQALIVEWFSPDFHDNDLKPFEAMVLLLFTGFAIRRPSLYDLLLSLTVLALALQSVRHIALFVAATTPVLVATWSAIWREVAAARGWRLGNIPDRPLIAATTAAALAVISVATVAQAGAHLGRQHDVVAHQYPVGAADFLAANPGLGTRMFNQYGWGGYLVYRFDGRPGRQVFIFGEAALMGDGLLREYQDVASLRPDWQQVLDRNRVDLVVFDRDAALSTVLATQPGWRLAYSDSTAAIYVRTAPTS